MTFKCWYCVKRTTKVTHTISKKTKCSWLMAHSILRAFNDTHHNKQRNCQCMSFDDILLHVSKVVNCFGDPYRRLAVPVTAIFTTIEIEKKNSETFRWQPVMPLDELISYGKHLRCIVVLIHVICHCLCNQNTTKIP